MVGEWRRTTWGKIATLEYGKALQGYSQMPSKAREFGTNGPIGWHTVGLWEGPGVVIGRKGAYRGVNHTCLPYWVIDTAYSLRPNPEVCLHHRWAYYQIKYLDPNNIDDGSPIPSTTRSSFYAQPVNLPPFDEQCRIADLLGALDEKIELNRGMAETLEAMARALFRSWFVDFDPVHARAEGRPTGLSDDLLTLFPDSFGEAELPEGWKAFPLSELCKLDRTTCDPSAFGQGLVSHFSIPAYDNGRRPAVVAASDIKSLKLRLTAPIVLFSKLNPDTPRIWPIASTSNRPALASTEYLALRPARPAATYAYLALLLSSQSFIARAASMVTGTSKSHQRVQAEALMATTWVAPPTGVLQAFDNRAEPLLSRAEAARDQCETLAGIRDTLLPRLISGELLIADAEQRVAAA